MKPNVGSKERYFRIGIGTVAAIAAVTVSPSRWFSALLGVIAASGIETGFSRYCPLNTVLGIDHAPGLKKSPLKRLT